ncbi:MAG: metal ABC transporter ATP-binding protein [Chlamydiia bacterium]|nr:metal ABC transporter ATP-binding protein [Chlamydiia bacterium]
MPHNPFAVEINQLTVNYDQTPALWDISLQIPQGHLVGIIGPNGAGKSTLIKAALGFVKPLAGSVSFFGFSRGGSRRQIAYVPQRESVDWDFPITVRELVMMGRYGHLSLCQRPRQADWEMVDQELERVGMLGFANRQISQLSGGQQQRVFIARALSQDADLYFLDEPFVGIDHTTEELLVQLFLSLKKKGKTLCIVHHDLGSIESFFDWLVILNVRLIASGPCSEVFNPDTLGTAYGKSFALFDEATRLSQSKQTGLRP